MTWAPIAVAAVQAVGSVVSGISQHAQAQSEANVARANADLAEQQGASEAQAIREKARRLAGENRAAAGASGVDISGSFLDALSDSDINAELDAQTALWNSKTEATNGRGQAKASSAAGSSALVGGFFGAGSAAISGYGNWHQAKTEAGIEDLLASSNESQRYIKPKSPSVARSEH